MSLRQLEFAPTPSRPRSVNAVQLHALPYRRDSQHWFACVRPLGQAVWLDSAYPHSPRGRFDIISAAPLQLITPADAHHDTFATINQALQSSFREAIDAPANTELPFRGGAIGLLGYELGRQLEGLGDHRVPDPPFPCALIGIYSWAIISDHQRHQTWLLIRPETSAELQRELLDLLSREPAPPQEFEVVQPWRENLTSDDYAKVFARLQQYIRAGDCYQVNLARRFQTRYCGDPLSAYLTLRNTAAAPFSAFLDFDDGAVLCLSPERFLAANGRELFTQPIKGTIARSDDATIDQAHARALLSSEKNRAENLMIVDLLRNDLGRSCEPGSIHVEQLFELQSFATVHHLVSSIRGTLRNELHALDALKNAFPGGSVTGAPKHRAMQIIDELEPNTRSIFCGAIGYVSVCGRMDTNITIRTLLAQHGDIYAWAGGGIVADSNCAEEFEETRSKIEPLLRALIKAP